MMAAEKLAAYERKADLQRNGIRHSSRTRLGRALVAHGDGWPDALAHGLGAHWMRRT